MATTVADLIADCEPRDFTPFPTLAEANANGKPRLTIVVSCMDPRCSIEKFIGLNVGSKTGELVMQSRNAGGNIRFAVRDILLIDRQFGLDEVVVVHHTDCGSLTFTNEGLRDAVKERIDSAHWSEIDKINWGANTE
ncbi:hypothetical protein B0I35DRAFT_472245 [Stachybotrys elegans]|uniref:Carbonic anhydrase n=1 Tax=Stachybotrys elegans TaxID=80388 RepID=A0A8K0SDG9_9HYPO|nr:hypothetical protein B0I35DRAFT_472245 [Stachybotrys elegans]